TFLFTGHETTSVSMTWTLYALASNPDVQEKVRREIRMVLEEHHLITLDVLEKLPYLENAIKESLRLFSPAPMTFRVAINDDKIDKYDIPKGTVITIVPPHRYALPDYFPDPLQFNPDRWEDSNYTDKYSYVPFLAGPRTCIGNKF
ncbi:uncharacterized protein TRIADDRAFT_7968, partial [Trichoplax adhaerens]